MCYNAETEKEILIKIQKISKNFRNEIAGELDFSGAKPKYTFDSLGDCCSVFALMHQANFHTHPSSEMWRYGGPPSVLDYASCISFPYMSCYVVGQKYAYRYRSMDLDSTQLEKLEKNFLHYMYVGEMLESGIISANHFMKYVKKYYGITVFVINLLA